VPDAIPGGNSWREALLESVAGSLELTREEAEAAMFADLSENQRLTALDPLTPESLLFRFNTAQVQGLLLGAERVWVTSPWPPPRRLRQLMRYVKFFGLLFSQDHVPSGGATPPMLSLTLDGPLSILASATRYGLQLAQFFPALLLWDEPWQLRAEVSPGRGAHGGKYGDKRRGMLEIERHPWLRSHYADRGMWVPEQVVRFVESFNSATGKAVAGNAAAGSTVAGKDERTPWQAAPAEDVLMLPGNRALVPDFVFRRHQTGATETGAVETGAVEFGATETGAETGATVYLEHLAYPVPAQVMARLERLKHAGRKDYLLACRGVPAIQALNVPCPPLIAYRRTLLPSTVREALNALDR
jgi:predicted nuclease of restriction endonuclease-like RecB superfamily